MKNTLLSVLLVFGMSSFLNAQNDCTPPVINTVVGGGTYCLNENVQLRVTGNLNNAVEWSWYSGQCGGQVIATGTTLTVRVTESSNYFVRGTGGCVANSSSCYQVEVKLDDIAPEILTEIDDITVENETGTCQAVVEYAIPEAIDNCSDELTIERISGPESGSSFPVGSTEVSYELSDGLGNTSLVSFIVNVIDSESPVIECIEDIEADNDPGECGAIVYYEIPVGEDNCPGAITTLTEGLGSGSFFPVGTTIEKYTVTDASGNESACSINVTVYDVEPPVIKLSDKSINLWPPNHKHHDLAIRDHIESVSDNCGSVSIEDVVIEEISSDEAQNDRGDGNTDSDIVIADDCRNMLLLAERSGLGNGRVYSVNLALKDLHGNIGRASYVVEVPHDMGRKHSTIDDGPQYTVNGCDLEESENSSSNSSSRVDMAIQTFPNPFTNKVEVGFTPKFSDQIKIELFNMNGVKIKDLMETEVKAGIRYDWNFDLSSLDKNIYIIVIWGDKNYGIKRINNNN